MEKHVKCIKSEWYQDFRFFNPQDSGEYGVCYENSKKSWVTLHLHESFDDIVNTAVHESIHMAIRDDMGCDMNEMQNMDGEEEHEVMKRVFWALNGWI